MDLDIGPVLEEWEYVPNQIVARHIVGDDGRDKIQMRVDLGLLQMDADGRPDGSQPHGMESLLEYHLSRLEQAAAAEHADFALTRQDCADLQSEGLQYYHRYICCFALEDYERAERDTARNLRMFDLVYKHAEDPEDKWGVEQYRPYVLMMNARAKAALKLQAGRRGEALRIVDEAITRIEKFFAKHDQAQLAEASREIAFLKLVRREIRDGKPPSREQALVAQLQQAVDMEDYRTAARLRDELERLGAQRQSSESG